MASCKCGVENKAILSVLSELKSDVTVIKSKVDLVHRTVHEGNGMPPLVTRVALLESEVKSGGESSKSRLLFWSAIITAFLGLVGMIVNTIVMSRHGGG